MTRLELLPCIDSAALAAERQRELDVPRGDARELGWTAVEASKAGRYVDGAGRQVDWSTAVAAAVKARLSLPPDAPLPDGPKPAFDTTRIQVSNETTMGAARRLVSSARRPLALNFANGVETGGGVLRGSRAQEETLCRSSALYLTLDGDPMYAAHRSDTSYASSAWCILSPDVPFFRLDDGSPIDEPWLLSVITCAAPVAPHTGQPRAGDLLQQRIGRVLAIARAYGYETLVLGAWGCGAFGNDPERTARDFRTALEGEFAGAFSEVVFAISDWSPDRRYLGPFRDVFAPTR